MHQVALAIELVGQLHFDVVVFLDVLQQLLVFLLEFLFQLRYLLLLLWRFSLLTFLRYLLFAEHFLSFIAFVPGVLVVGVLIKQILLNCFFALQFLQFEFDIKQLLIQLVDFLTQYAVLLLQFLNIFPRLRLRSPLEVEFFFHLLRSLFQQPIFFLQSAYHVFHIELDIPHHVAFAIQLVGEFDFEIVVLLDEPVEFLLFLGQFGFVLCHYFLHLLLTRLTRLTSSSFALLFLFSCFSLLRVFAVELSFESLNLGLLQLELLLSFVVPVFEELVLLFEDFDVSLQVKLHISDHVAFAIQLISKFNFSIVIFLNIIS